MKNIITNLRNSLLLAMSLICVDAYAQTNVSGVVRDSRGEPVPGVMIMIEGNNAIGTVTDIDGRYSVVIPDSVRKPALKASCLGFSDIIEVVSERTVVNFVLKEETTRLDEVVVIGYGSVKKSDLTGSVSSVRVDESLAARSSSLDQLLQGRTAGVQVLSQSGAPDAGVSIRIRGLSSLNGSTEPLYVVDGILINASQDGDSVISKGDNADGGEESNGLMGINPQDIASIEILKDASATAIYGALGANGVILITTKTATKERPTINFNGGIDVSNIYKKADILDTNEYISYLNDKIRLGVGSDPSRQLNRMLSDPGDPHSLKVTPVDWQDYVLRTAISQRYYLSIAGRPKSLTYSFSFGYLNKQGIVRLTGVKQYTARLNLDKTINKKIRFGTKTSLAYIDSDQTQGTGGGRFTNATSLIRSMLSSRPYTSQDLESEDDEELDPDLRSSPNRWLNKNHFINTRQEYRVTSNIYLNYKVIPSLTFRSSFGCDYRNGDRQKFKSAYINTSTEGTNGGTVTTERFNWNFDNYFNFVKKFKGLGVNFTLGSAASKTMSTSQSVQGWNIEQYMGQMASINAAPNSSVGYAEGFAQTLSFYTRGIYNYKERYVLTATFRADGSSKFKGANKWAYFPSLAFAWRLKQEPWFDVDWVSSAKLRLSWGRVGNQAIANFMTMSNYSVVSNPVHNQGNDATIIKGLAPSNLANPDLKWETTEQFNTGLDLGLFRDRLSLSIDAYYKTTFDLLQEKEIPTSSGFTKFYINEGTINNRGIELSLEAVPVKTGNFEWIVSGNLTFNKNRIIRLSETAEKKNIWVSTTENIPVIYKEGGKIGSSDYVAQSANIFMEGYPMGLFYGYKIKRILGPGETGVPLSLDGKPGVTGQFDYYDLNNNGYIDEEDRTIIGDPNPDFTYGFSTTLGYKRFSVSLNFVGCHGADIFNSNLATQTDTYTSARTILRDAYYKAWTPENADTKYPALGMIRSDDYKKFSDFYVEDGSYLRLQNISVGYDLPLKKAKLVKKINFSIALQNVFVWTKYSGWDPDVNSFGTNIMKMGIDQASYPSCRTATFDLKFTF